MCVINESYDKIFIMKHNINRIFMISDTHLGVRNSSVEWMDIIKEYFYNFLIPLLKKESKPGDVLFHLGDLFDSRQSLNLMIMNEGMKIFEDISKILPVYIILGNHDIYKKFSNDINSVKVLSWIPNITVVEEPMYIETNTKKLFLMPWRANHEEETQCIKNHSGNYLFCHADVTGLKFNRKVSIEEGIDLDDLSKFDKVYSGHIHYAQKKKNFTMLGCPYPLTRSDMNNKKGVICLDIESGTEEYFENTLSPKFIRVNFDKILDMEEDDVKEMFRNNFVDVMVDHKWTLNFPFSTFYDDVTGYRVLEFIQTVTDDENEYLLDGDEDMGKIDIVELANKLIQNTSHNDNIKDKLLSVIKILHSKVNKLDGGGDDEE